MGRLGSELRPETLKPRGFAGISVLQLPQHKSPLQSTYQQQSPDSSNRSNCHTHAYPGQPARPWGALTVDTHAIQKATVGVGATCVSRGSAPEVALQ